MSDHEKIVAELNRASHDSAVEMGLTYGKKSPRVRVEMSIEEAIAAYLAMAITIDVDFQMMDAAQIDMVQGTMDQIMSKVGNLKLPKTQVFMQTLANAVRRSGDA